MKNKMEIDTSVIKKKLKEVLNDKEILDLTSNKKVYFIHAKNAKPPYIEYQVVNSKGSDYSEGNINYINHLVQVDIFSLDDYTELETVIINKLIKDGFQLNPGSPDLYEKNTNLYHKPLRFNIDLPTS
ncbi:prohead protease [Romboutsia sp. 1001216sp1]|uniref:prohead protease n=1 Tax=unclassified Romboutsia TaxID=2626894 RepID=UPI001FACEE8E|nr:MULTISPECIES: prohead protease [unclassified Romboutsia]MDB8790631.1 prohead protease [Romboutsia sp. 1001216sp1]MDB8803250.1 prohead protease [Romboutsia sp. 1001216sp1]MDB8814642.1 prohead protease [Romboutsia sp. 1001216sp1]